MRRHIMRICTAVASFLLPVLTRRACQRTQSFVSHLHSRLRLTKVESSPSSHYDRRSILRNGIPLSISVILQGSVARADENQFIVKKPYASQDALLPAARVKLLIDRAVDVATELANVTEEQRKKDLVEEMEGILLSPHNITRGAAPLEVPKKPARQYLDSYREKRSELPLLAQPGAYFVQRGEIGAWKRLKRQERLKESEDEIRAALNMYTSSLNFNADSYVFNAPKEERSRLIREDRLPDVRTVIASDMGMRYLHRNELLSALDSSRAELQYQLKERDVNAVELLELLREAQAACQRWFSLIDEQDARNALEAVKLEPL